MFCVFLPPRRGVGGREFELSCGVRVRRRHHDRKIKYKNQPKTTVRVRLRHCRVLYTTNRPCTSCSQVFGPDRSGGSIHTSTALPHTATNDPRQSTQRQQNSYTNPPLPGADSTNQKKPNDRNRPQAHVSTRRLSKSHQLPAHEVEVLQVLVVRYPRVGADLHAHLVDTRVLEQRKVGVEQPAADAAARNAATEGEGNDERSSNSAVASAQQ